ncbi:MAG: YihY/virulence factor BrkB family protein [Odoribacter sp.]|nr:YihY/virulence factor BrkB family protein [Odoribacter sp.]
MKRIGNLKKFLYPEFYYSVLRRDWRISTFVTDFFLKTVAVLVVSADRFVKDASAISASALTFYSTLSFIPVVALILAIARGFGAASALEDWLKEQTYTNPEVMQWVMNVAGKALDHTQGGVIAGFGILLLIWSVIRMLSSTELAMNRIWGVKKGRGIVKKFTDYLSILFIAPILIVLISSMNVFMMSNLQNYALDEGFLSYAGVALKALLTVIPYVLVWFLFVFLYMFMPTTPVKFKYALVSGIVAGTIFQVVQWFYIRFQVGVSSYNAIYGGLAALPLLLVWLQLSWSIVLWGTELCYIMRNRHFLYRDVLYAGNRWVDNVDVAVRVLRYIAEEYAGGQGGTALSALCKKLRISSSKVRIVVEELVEQKVLVEVKDEDDVSYFPAMDFRNLALSDIIVRLSDMGENRGEEWKTRFVQAIKREFAEDTFA